MTARQALGVTPERPSTGGLKSREGFAAVSAGCQLALVLWVGRLGFRERW